jgi:hypothetical protein
MSGGFINSATHITNRVMNDTTVMVLPEAKDQIAFSFGRRVAVNVPTRVRFLEINGG